APVGCVCVACQVPPPTGLPPADTFPRQGKGTLRFPSNAPAALKFPPYHLKKGRQEYQPAGCGGGRGGGGLAIGSARSLPGFAQCPKASGNHSNSSDAGVWVVRYSNDLDGRSASGFPAG